MYFYPCLCISLRWLCIHLFFIGSLKLNNTSFFFCETSVLYERNFLIIKSPMKTFISVSTLNSIHPHTHPHLIFSLPIQCSLLQSLFLSRPLYKHPVYNYIISIIFIIDNCQLCWQNFDVFKVESWSWQMKKMSSAPHLTRNGSFLNGSNQ